MNKLKKIIILLLPFVAIIAIAIVLVNNNKFEYFHNKEKFVEKQIDESKITINSTDFDYVKYNSDYYGISKVLNGLIEDITILYSKTYGQSQNIVTNLSDQDKEIYVDRILSVLSKKYNEKYNINKETLKKYVSGLINGKYRIDNMYCSLRDNDVTVYLVYGTMNSSNNYNFMVAVDSKSNAYEVYLNNYVSDFHYDENNINSLKIENDNIKLNDYNKFDTRDITDEEMAKNYLKNYQQVLLNSLKDAYKMLDDEYKKSRFESYDIFEEYYFRQAKELMMSSLKQYKVISNNNYTDYICIDNFDNCFTFRSTAVMKYTVLLDEYTIETDEFKEKYKSATNLQKVYTNVEKFIKMINSKDYTAAYNLLDEEYRASSFNNKEEFEKYVESQFYKYNIIKSFGNTRSIDDKKAYTCTAIIKDATKANFEYKEVDFTTFLKEDTQFSIEIIK